MNYMKLDRIVTISSGQNAPQDQNEYCLDGYTFIKVSNLDDIINDDNESKACKITVEAISNNKLKVVPKKSILFAKSGLSCVKNRVYLTKKETYVVNHLCILSNVIDSYDPEWLLYFIKAFDVTKLIKDESYPSISLKDIKNINVPVISKEKQQSMIKNLNYINSLIKKKQKESFFLDELIKSQFIEMFGDVFYNDNRYNQVKIRDIVKYEQPTKYIVSSEEYNNSYETPVLTAGKNFILGYTKEKNGIFIGSKEKVIIFDDFTCDSKIVNFDFKVKSSAIKILHMKKGVNIDFFYNVLKQHHYNVANHKRHWISTFEIMKIGLPPLKLQNKYASFVEQIDKSKFIVQKEIKDLQELLDKKMDEYFGQ